MSVIKLEKEPPKGLERIALGTYTGQEECLSPSARLKHYHKSQALNEICRRILPQLQGEH